MEAIQINQNLSRRYFDKYFFYVSMLDNQLKDRKCIVSSEKPELWKIVASSTAANCKNYIREIIDTLDLQPNPEKSVIALSIGDPTIYGNLKPSDETVRAVLDVLKEGSWNGYAPCVGYEPSRNAVADYLSHDKVEFKTEDIILCSGCSSALDISITALCDGKKNHNLLMPRPGFSIYRTLAEVIGVNVKYYNLIPEKDWEIDIKHLESQIDQNTAVMILNNPSNPCGSVYSEEHLRDVLEVAHNHKIPVIADEIYEQIVFPGHKFVSTASLDVGVPILVCGGLAKRFLVPGWRLGWIAVYDTIRAFRPEIRKALASLSQRIIGSNTLIQGALSGILRNTPQSFHDNLIATLLENAQLAFECLRKVKGLVPYMPQGTMYMMVEVHFNKFPFNDGLHFTTKLMEEESVFCLPGDFPGFMRIVLTVPKNLMLEACHRISEFCSRHHI